jgi:hypothetical protein
MCTVLLPSGGNPISVEYILSYHVLHIPLKPFRYVLHVPTDWTRSDSTRQHVLTPNTCCQDWRCFNNVILLWGCLIIQLSSCCEAWSSSLSSVSSSMHFSVKLELPTGFLIGRDAVRGGSGLPPHRKFWSSPLRAATKGYSKVKICLCTPQRHTVYSSGGVAAHVLNLGSGWRWMSSFAPCIH